MISCGWCGKPTASRDRCTSCGHVDPERPWLQRAEPVPHLPPADGRPPLTVAELRKRLSSLGANATEEQIAEHFDVDPRTVRRWRQKVSG